MEWTCIHCIHGSGFQLRNSSARKFSNSTDIKFHPLRRRVWERFIMTPPHSTCKDLYRLYFLIAAPTRYRPADPTFYVTTLPRLFPSASMRRFVEPPWSPSSITATGEGCRPARRTHRHWMLSRSFAEPRRTLRHWISRDHLGLSHL